MSLEAHAHLRGQLASTIVAAPEAHEARWLLMLHGIYGRGRNWTSVARAVTGRRADWACALVDLRLHGDSPAFAPPHTVEAAASDVVAFEEGSGFSAEAMLGHSFGGKVALAHAARGHDRLQQVWVIDSTPDAKSPRGSAWRLLEVVRQLPDSFASRREAAAGIEAAGYSAPLAAWMASNLNLDHRRYRWRLDLDAVGSLLLDFFNTDLWDVVEDPPAETALHFVKAAESDVLTEPACSRIEAAGRRHGRAFVHRIAGGHWVNTDNPGAVVDLLARHLPAPEPQAPARPVGRR